MTKQSSSGGNRQDDKQVSRKLLKFHVEMDSYVTGDTFT